MRKLILETLAALLCVTIAAFLGAQIALHLTN